MLQETCWEIDQLEAHWVAEREARTARRRKIQYIDELLEELEKLNLAEEDVARVECGQSVELKARASRTIGFSSRVRSLIFAAAEFNC